MSCSTIMFSLFMLSPCGAGGGSGAGGGGADFNDAIAAAIANPLRPAQDFEKDLTRKPAKVLSFFNIEPGMTVLDLFSGGGYYSEMLNSIVAEDGKVIAHTNQAYIPFVGEIYQTRYVDGRLANTETIISEADELEFDENSLDAVLMVLTWHDFLYADAENGWNSINEDQLMQKLCTAMKPGAILGLIDHVANSGGETARIAKNLHRIDPQVIRDTFADSCFELQAEADFLANPEDDHTLAVFDKTIRGNTDRFVFKFVRK